MTGRTFSFELKQLKIRRVGTSDLAVQKKTQTDSFGDPREFHPSDRLAQSAGANASRIPGRFCSFARAMRQLGGLLSSAPRRQSRLLGRLRPTLVKLTEPVADEHRDHVAFRDAAIRVGASNLSMNLSRGTVPGRELVLLTRERYPMPCCDRKQLMECDRLFKERIRSEFHCSVDVQVRRG